MKINVILFLFPILLLSVSIQSAINKYGLWSALQYSGEFEKKPDYLYELELHAEFINKNNVFDEGLIRFGLGYALDGMKSLMMGFDFFPALGFSNRQHEEYRIWQQLEINSTTKRINLFSRTKIEERKKSGYSQIALRLRQRFTLQSLTPLFKNFLPLVYDEIFFNFNKANWVDTHIINQNRIFLGFDRSYSSFSLEIGYLNRAFFGTKNVTITHILYLTWKF